MSFSLLIPWLVMVLKEKKSVNNDNKIDSHQHSLWTSSNKNNNRRILMPTTMCLEIGDKRRNAYIFSSSWALGLVLRLSVHHAAFILFFFLLLKKRICEWFLFCPYSNTPMHTVIIILIIDVFWLVAFAYINYRTDSNGTMKSKKKKKGTNNITDQTFAVLVANQKKTDYDEEKRVSKRQNETNFVGGFIDRVKKRTKEKALYRMLW